MWTRSAHAAYLCLFIVVLNITSEARELIQRRYLEEKNDAMNRVIVAPDAGRRFRLGQLYDARTEKLVSALLWSADLIEAHTVSTDTFFTTTKVSTEDSLKDRAELLNIDIEVTMVQLIYPSVEIEFSGSFKFLKDKKTSTNAVRMAASFMTRTRTYVIDSFNSELLSPANMNSQAFENYPGCTAQDENKCKIATHFVSSIRWGANVVTSFESFYTSEEEKVNLEIALRGKLAVPSARLEVEAGGRVQSDDEQTNTLSRTQVSIVGDIRVTSDIPSTVDEAMEFMGSLPELTQTMEGDGVPMDIILTPLSWMDNKAGRLANRIAADTMNEIIQIYDSLDDSENRIQDALRREHGGFVAWKRAMDSYYIRFRHFRADFSLALGDALSEFKADAFDITFITTLQNTYKDQNNNVFTKANVAQKMQEEEDVISNLLALAAEFKKNGITLAENLREYMAPTFDTRYDRVYAVIMVGMKPNNDRPGIARVREFNSLAKARHKKGIKTGIDHCVYQIDPQGNGECVEDLAFVAIHFDSFCSDMCNNAFCVTDDDLPLCPRTSGDPPNCKLEEAVATQLQCHTNTHIGNCGDNDYPSHDITNHEKPFSDCWCACPSTQVIEFVNNRAPRRLTDDMPKVPAKPTISGDVQTLPFEPDPMFQIVVLTLEAPVAVDPAQAALNYAVTLELRDVVVDKDNDLFYVTTQTDVYTENDKTRIILRELVAGETYVLKVSGMNDIGIGPYDQTIFTVGHRMIVGNGICVLPKVETLCDQPRILENNRTFPAWLDTQLNMGFSTATPLQAERITMHKQVDLDVGTGQFSELNDDSQVLAECNFGAEESIKQRDELQCNFELKRLYKSTSSYKTYMQTAQSTVNSIPVYLAAWDEFGVLLAKNAWTALLPSGTNCLNYGPHDLSCIRDDERKCVSKCEDCQTNMVEREGMCTIGLCAGEQIYCGVPFAHRPDDYIKEKEDASLSESCLEGGVDKSLICKTKCHEFSNFYEHSTHSQGNAICLAPCYIKLADNYETDFEMRRGVEGPVGCELFPAPGFVKQSGSEFTLTCPSIPGEYDDYGTKWLFDDKVIRSAAFSSYTNIEAQELICARCASGQVFDQGLQVCAYERPNKAVMNIAPKGSFDDPNALDYWWWKDAEEFWDFFFIPGQSERRLKKHNANLERNEDVSLDAAGGSLFIPKGSKAVQIIPSTLGVKRNNYESFETNVLHTNSGATWSLSLYFKVPKEFKGQEETKKVGTARLGLHRYDLGSSVELAIAPGTSKDWISVTTRFAFYVESYMTIEIDITQGEKVADKTTGIYIDMIELVAVTGVTDFTIASHDLTNDLAIEYTKANTLIGEVDTLFDDQSTKFDEVKEFNDDNQSTMTDKDLDQDELFDSLSSTRTGLNTQLDANTNIISTRRSEIDSHERTRKARCTEFLFNHYNREVCA